MTHARTPPEPAPSWDGAWDAVDPLTELWLLGAMNRTVSVLPRLHPWRLGDGKGSGRLLQWSGLADQPMARPAYGVLAVTARDPDLSTSDEPGAGSFGLGGDPVSDLLGAAIESAWGTASSALDDAVAGARPRWAGALTRLSGAWLPAMAVLPRSERGLDDPGTGWATESVDFDAQHTVHAADLRFAADVLAPHVMAVVLDRVPQGAALTLAGDAVHLWWPYREPHVSEPARAARAAEVVVRFAEAVPSFLLTDHPDHSERVEQALDARTAAAEAYRSQRRLGHSPDPVLQRIYDQSRARLGEP